MAGAIGTQQAVSSFWTGAYEKRGLRAVRTIFAQEAPSSFVAIAYATSDMAARMRGAAQPAQIALTCTWA